MHDYGQLKCSNKKKIPFYGRHLNFCELPAWKYEDFKNEIKKFLRGEEIILNADILKAPKWSTSMNGVKFNNVLLDFRLVNGTVWSQDILYSTIAGLPVKMQMIGNNYFRCDKRIYSFPAITYPFNLRYFIHSLDGKMDYIMPEHLYASVKNEDPFYSPYTVWKFQLEEERLRRGSRFANKKIDLLLIGEICFQ